jgi:cellulose biosynthesis protein BcsQ
VLDAGGRHVLIACWSAKGGSGTTVIATCLALLLAAREPAGAVLADLDGDAPATLGLPETDSPGLAGWLAAGDDVPADALGRLQVQPTRGLDLLPRGPGSLHASRARVLAALFEQGVRPVVADCGTRPEGATAVVAGAASHSLLVTRPCYLALRHAARPAQRPTGVIVVREPGRSLDRHDIERVVGAPVVAEVDTDPAVARAVDAGLLSSTRLPRLLERGLSRAV